MAQICPQDGALFLTAAFTGLRMHYRPRADAARRLSAAFGTTMEQSVEQRV